MGPKVLMSTKTTKRKLTALLGNECGLTHKDIKAIEQDALVEMDLERILYIGDIPSREADDPMVSAEALRIIGSRKLVSLPLNVLKRQLELATKRARTKVWKMED